MKQKAITQKQVTVIMAIVLLGAVIVLVGSVYSIYHSALAQQTATQKKEHYVSLAEDLMEASDYLNNQVEKFVVTGEKKYLEDYWAEVDTNRSREKIMEELSALNLTEKEYRMLGTAKETSDLLVYLETRAMKLKAESLSMKKSELPAEVAEYILNVQEQSFGRREKGRHAEQLIFDWEYSYRRSIINDSIRRFKNAMYERLENELQISIQHTNTVVRNQMVAIGVIGGLFVLVHFMFYKLVLYPIADYTDCLKRQERDKKKYWLVPHGSQELRMLAMRYNELYENFLEAEQAKSNFFANMSHEIRTPIQAIKGFQYLLKDTELSGQQEEYVDKIGNASENLLEIVNNILDFSKLEQAKYEIEKVNFSLTALAEKLRDIFSYQAREKQIDFIVDYPEEEQICYGDEGKIRQIVTNLVSNAIKFTEKGSVTLCFRFIEGEKRGTYFLSIRVEDTGVGIEKAALDKIFDAYVQSNLSVTRRFGGTGLGLSISQEFAKMLGGSISVTSSEGAGTCFIVRIPMEEGMRERIVENKIVKNKTFQNKLVLLVDDNGINLKMERTILENWGLMVDAVATGEKAIDQVREKNYDVIFMDIRMEGMDGFEAARKIRQLENGKEVYIIALTADVEVKTREKVKKAGMQYFMAKPLDFQQVYEVLLQHFGEDRQPKMSHDSLKIDMVKTDKQLLNVEKGLLRLENNRVLYEELLMDFIHVHEKQIEHMGDLLTIKDEKSIGKLQDILHELKGVCKTIAAERLVNKIIRLETFIKNNSLYEINEIALYSKEIKECYEETKEVIEKYCENRGRIVKYKAGILKEQDEILFQNQKYDDREPIETLLAFLKMGDLDSISYFEKHRNVIQDICSLEDYKILQKELEQYQLYEAYKIFRKYGADSRGN